MNSEETASHFKTRDLNWSEEGKMLHVQRLISLPLCVNCKVWLHV